jgi:hypothetical protein
MVFAGRPLSAPPRRITPPARVPAAVVSRLGSATGLSPAPSSAQHEPRAERSADAAGDYPALAPSHLGDVWHDRPRPDWTIAHIGHVSPAFTFSVYQQFATRRCVDEQAILALMQFADEPAPSRQTTRGEGRSGEVETGEFDQALERFNEAVSGPDEAGV